MTITVHCCTTVKKTFVAPNCKSQKTNESRQNVADKTLIFFNGTNTVFLWRFSTVAHNLVKNKFCTMLFVTGKVVKFLTRLVMVWDLYNDLLLLTSFIMKNCTWNTHSKTRFHNVFGYRFPSVQRDFKVVNTDQLKQNENHMRRYVR